jgi:hypothetical protein
MSRNIIARCVCLAFVLGCASLSQADDWKSVRGPLGVYAHTDIETAINNYPGPASPTTKELHSYLHKLYADLLADHAISGITLGVHWGNIQLTDPALSYGYSDGYDWSYLDDAFEEANFAHKSIQLIITPGFDSPKWLLVKSKIPSCDGLFPGSPGPVSADCGTVTFVNYPEADRSDGNVLPLPWNSVYKEAWLDFLTHLNARYNYNPAFVSIAIAGPVGGSTEIILPTNLNTTAPQPSGLPVDKMWTMLIENSFPYASSSFQNSDQAFIDEWRKEVEGYEKIFRGLTLFISPDTGNDLPDFSQNVTPHQDNILFYQDCQNAIEGLNNSIMSCEAKTEILSNFIAAEGPNGKSTQVGGMTASSPVTLGDIGVPGIKLLTSHWPPPSPRFLGGAEFDLAVSNPKQVQQEGCPNSNPTCTITPEEAAYNVMTVFFYGTPAGKVFDGARGPAPMQYLELDYVDIQYAEMNPCPPTLSRALGKTSLQDLLSRASRDLFEMAGQPTPLPPPTCN